MYEKLKVKLPWLQKVAICLAFIGFLSAKNAAAYALPPLITVPPVGATVQVGDTVTLTTTVGVSLTPLTIKWYLNGSGGITSMKNVSVLTTSNSITGTTLSTLTITNITTAQGGNYCVKVDNSGGEVTSSNAVVVVLVPASPATATATIVPTQCGKTNNGFHLGLLKPAQSNCDIEATTDFVNWTPIYTNSSGSTNFSYLDDAATNLVSRYYRARLQ